MSINLDNFEVVEFARDTPFVLTSPTSLEACAQLDIEILKIKNISNDSTIKPLELVYQSLEHFEEACCHLPLSEIYRIYEEAETNRQAKLLQCREQRKGLLLERARKSMTLTNYHDRNNNNDNRTNNQTRPLSSSSSSVAINNHDNTTASPKSSANPGQTCGTGTSVTMKKKKSTSATSVPARVNFQRNDLQTSKSASTLSTRAIVKNSNNHNHNLSRGRTGERRRSNLSRAVSSASAAAFQQHPTSDTESNEGTLHLLPAVNRKNCDNCGNNNQDYYPSSSRSVPDLRRGRGGSGGTGSTATSFIRGNLDFRKVAASASWSPRRHYCLCHLELRDQDILSEYFKRYDDVLSTTEISEEDRKIMERLILKRARMLEWERQSQDLREIIEIDRMKKYRASQLLAQQWADKLAEKRRLENLENHKRYLRMQDKLQRQQEDLKLYLNERDQRIQRYLEELTFKKKRSMVEKQRLEALRQLEVSKAIERLLDEDKQRRRTMHERLQKRMTEAEIRKQRREQDYWRHVSEMNRLDDVKRTLKLEKIEQQARATVSEIRHQIEEKEHRVRLNQLRHLESRDRALESGAGRHQRAIEKARHLHEELLRGIDEWNRKAFELHVAAQERAGLKHYEEISRRRARAASERILREERTHEMLRRVHEMEEKKKEMVKSVIDNKNMKSARVKAEKERSISLSRIRAQHAAEMRQQLKETLNPETFDKKAARAELEVRALRKGDFVVRFNPKLLVGRRCSCNGRGYHHGRNSFRGGNNNGHSHCLNNGGSGNYGGGFCKGKKDNNHKCFNHGNGKDKKKLMGSLC